MVAALPRFWGKRGVRQNPYLNLFDSHDRLVRTWTCAFGVHAVRSFECGRHCFDLTSTYVVRHPSSLFNFAPILVNICQILWFRLKYDVVSSVRSLDNDRASPSFVILKHTIYRLRHDVVSIVRSEDNDRASPDLVFLFSCFFDILKFSCFSHFGTNIGPVEF